MFLFDWLRKRPARKRGRTPQADSVREAGITARVDMIRFEALAEASYDSLFESIPGTAMERFEETHRYFDGAIDAARIARLPHEVARLTRRRDQVVRIYNSQFRYSNGR